MFEILDEVCTPTKGSKYSACVDLFAREDVVIGAGETVLVGLGVKIDTDFFIYEIGGVSVSTNGEIKDEGDINKIEDFLKSHQLNLHIRSSMSAKHGLIIANGTGIIDLDYEGEIMICLHKPLTLKSIFKYIFSFGMSKSKLQLKKGQKIAQINLVEHKTYLLGVDTEEERKGGFGSTDK